MKLGKIDGILKGILIGCSGWKNCSKIKICRHSGTTILHRICQSLLEIIAIIVVVAVLGCVGGEMRLWAIRSCCQCSCCAQGFERPRKKIGHRSCCSSCRGCVGVKLLLLLLLLLIAAARMFGKSLENLSRICCSSFC